MTMNKKNKQKKTILFLAANPEEMPKKSFDRECREIEDAMHRSKNRDYFKFEKKFKIDYKDIRRSLLDHNPQIVHFCGHAEQDGFLVIDKDNKSEICKPNVLADLLRLFKDSLECVFLSGCYTEDLANEITKEIPYTFGIIPGVLDKDAIDIVCGFYDGVATEGTYEFAYGLGNNAAMNIDSTKFNDRLKMKVNNRLAKKLQNKGMVDPNQPVKIAIRSFYEYYAKGLENEVDHLEDFCDRFNNRALVKGTWEEIKKKIEASLGQWIQSGKHYRLYIPLHNSLAFLVGRILHPKAGIKVGIYQPSIKSGLTLWELTDDPTNSNKASWKVEEQTIRREGEGLAVAISVTQNTFAKVKSYVENHPDIAHIIHLEIENISHQAIKNANHAFDAAYRAIEIINEKYRESKLSGLHLFISAPNAFTFMMGQQSRVLSNITLYEFPFDSKNAFGSNNAIEYFPSITI